MDTIIHRGKIIWRDTGKRWLSNVWGYQEQGETKLSDRVKPMVATDKGCDVVGLTVNGQKETFCGVMDVL